MRLCTGESSVGNTLFVIHGGFDGVQPGRGCRVFHRQLVRVRVQVGLQKVDTGGV